MNEGGCDLEAHSDRFYDDRVNVKHTITPDPKYFAKLVVSIGFLSQVLRSENSLIHGLGHFKP
jgi:hypothetical protein